MKYVVLLWLMLVPVATWAGTNAPVHIESMNEIRDIESLDAQVDDLLTKIAQCVAADLAPASECHCYYPDKLSQARIALRGLIEKHPGWENRAVLWWNGGDPANLHLGGLQRKIARPCNNVLTSR